MSIRQIKISGRKLMVDHLMFILRLQGIDVDLIGFLKYKLQKNPVLRE